MERNSAVLYVEVTFEQRHKGNEEESSADVSGGRAFEADKIAQGRSYEAGPCLACLSSCKETKVSWVGESKTVEGWD